MTTPDTTLLVALLTLFTSIVAIGWGTIQRNWQRVDRTKEAEEVRRLLDVQATHVRETLDRQADYVRSALDRQNEVISLRHVLMETHIAEVARALGANTALTQQGITDVKAFSDIANNVNEKIRSIGLDRRRDELARDAALQISNHTGIDTNTRVRDIQEDIKK